MNEVALEMQKSDVCVILIDTAKILMLDEFEVINWVKFIERFNLSQNREQFAMNIFFIALATKLLLNNQKNKEPFEVYLSKTNHQFCYFNYWVTVNNGKFY